MAYKEIKFPVDFERMAKLPPAPDGNGYPYRISAKDLMADFKAAGLLVDDTALGGLFLVVTEKNGLRILSLGGELDSGDSLPEGSAGDYLYHNGTAWVARTVTEQTISVCVGGTPTPITFLTVTT